MKKLVALAAVLAFLASCAGMEGSRTIPVKLSGAEEVPPLSVPGSGSGGFTIDPDGAVRGSVTTSGVDGFMAHIHQGARGQNGPVIIPLTKNGNTYTAPPNARLTDAQMQAFKAGNLYVNVHTQRNKGGEVRGQLQP